MNIAKRKQILEEVSLRPKAIPSKWHEDLKLAGELLTEAGVLYREVEALV